MSTPDADRMNATFRTVLEECSGAKNPVVCLAAHIVRLRADSSWDEAAVAEIEHAILRVIQALMIPR